MKKLIFGILMIQFTYGQTIVNLDNTFGSAGWSIEDFGSDGEIFNDITLQSDGKIVATGVKNNGFYNDLLITRYLSNGTLDSSFATNGSFLLDIFNYSDEARAVKIQTDGKIVVAGFTADSVLPSVLVVRFLPNGTLDPAFGTGGIVLTSIGTSGGFATDMELDPSGKIVVTTVYANGADEDFGILRYLDNGNLDTSFDGDGIVDIPVGLGNDYPDCLSILSDGTILVAGYSNGGTSVGFSIIKLLANGSLDNSFSYDGKVITTFMASTTTQQFVDMAVQTDGKIVLVGNTDDGTNYQFLLARYLSNGNIDYGFNTTGYITGGILGEYNLASSVILQPGNKILVTGYVTDGITSDFAIYSYNNNGTSDILFGNSGMYLTTTINYEQATSACLQPDGKLIIAGGTSDSTNNFNPAMARYILIDEISIDEPLEDSFQLFPNPVTGDFINLTGVPEAINNLKTISIYDIQGKCLVTFSEFDGLNSNIIQLPIKLCAGMYSMVINCSTGQTVKKVIKLD